jgi:hypothetical protein
LRVVVVCATRVMAALALVAVIGCQPEQRPTPGSVKTIGTPSGTGSVSASGSASVSGPAPAAAAPTAVAESKPAASPGAAVVPSKPDGIYTPTTNREIYQLIASDYQEIVALTNQVNEGKPLPAEEILDIYEHSRLARLGTQMRILRDFAREPARAEEYPEAAQFYASSTFLDDPVIAAINGTGPAAQYSPAQRRQAIQKGVIRIIYHWSRRYMIQARSSLNPGLVDEAWAIYMGKEVDGKYPNSLSGAAVSREGNFNRPGAVDAPLREAMRSAQQAANSKDAAAFATAEQDVYSRYHAIFYLSTARYLNEALKSVLAGNTANATAQQMEGLSYYHSIQPAVARADAAADKAIVAFYTSAPASITMQMRDETLAALNRTASALLLKPEDLVTPASFT